MTDNHNSPEANGEDGSRVPITLQLTEVEHAYLQLLAERGMNPDDFIREIIRQQIELKNMTPVERLEAMYRRDDSSPSLG